MSVLANPSAIWTPNPDCPYLHDYGAIFAAIKAGALNEDQVLSTYRELCKVDLFFLLRFGLGAWFADKPFVVGSCNEVQLGPDTDTLDLWAREHFKSTVITYAEVIQRIIRNPEVRIGIFSHTRPIAKAFLRQIMQTLEGDMPVRHWFPDIFWDNPRGQAPKWSEEDGIQVKRKGMPKEATIEAWGVVKGQPTSRHFDMMVFDDVVTIESVTSPEMIAKTDEAMQVAVSLGTDGGKRRYVGTHYHYADYYAKLKGILPKSHIRIKPATDTGTREGNPVLLSRERLDEILRDQGPLVFSCQQLLNPVDPSQQAFDWAQVRFYDQTPEGLTRILIVDPANSKKKGSDNTAMVVLGIDMTNFNVFLLDGCYAKLNLEERWTKLLGFSEQWLPLRIGYERYGKDSDIQHFEKMQAITGRYLPPIVELGGGEDRPDPP
jgi:hypothetical protein